MATPSLLVFAIVPLVAWRMYSRMRRLIGRQQSKAWRHWCAVVFFPLLLMLVSIGAFFSPWAMVALLCGVGTGIVLGIWGLRLTKYEAGDRLFFYTPNAHIGIVLSLLLTARVAYRLVQIYLLTNVVESATTTGGNPASSMASMQDFGRSPLTLLILGMLLAYYTTYAAGILRWRAKVKAERQALPPAAAS